MSPKYEFSASRAVRKGQIGEKPFDQLKSWRDRHKLHFIPNEQLLNFLVACNGDPEEAENTIEKYFRFKIKTPEFCSNWFFEDNDVQKAVRACDLCVVPKRTQNNEAVIVGRLSDTRFYNFHLGSLAKLVIMLIESFLRKSATNGFVAIIDMKGAGILHLTRARIGVIQNIFHYIQECLPCKISEIHVINTVSFIDKILLIIKPFIKKELFEAIRFHQTGADLQEVFAHLPKHCIPEDYGGAAEEHKVLTEKTYDELADINRFFGDLEEQTKLYQNIVE